MEQNPLSSQCLRIRWPKPGHDRHLRPYPQMSHDRSAQVPSPIVGASSARLTARPAYFGQSVPWAARP